MRSILLAIAVALMWLTAMNPGRAAEAPVATLKIGDAAPKLQVSKWIQGDPVKEFEAGTAYIVEFWATWCGPCRTSIPHLNEIHKKFKDQGLVVIGQDVWENDVSEVPAFVKEMGDKMTYRVALDDMTGTEAGRMADTWMTAAAQGGIPAAFLVNKQGRIAWIGHPMQLKDATIEQVLAGTFDLEQAAKDQAAQLQNEQELAALWSTFGEHMEKQQWDEAEKTLVSMEKLLPEEHRAGMDFTRFEMQLMKKDFPAACLLAKRLSEAHQSDSMVLNQLAWGIALAPDADAPALTLANTMASRANSITENKDASILDTLARVKFRQGDKEGAIELQKAAVKFADDRMKEQLTATLESYQADQLPDIE